MSTNNEKIIKMMQPVIEHILNSEELRHFDLDTIIVFDDESIVVFEKEVEKNKVEEAAKHTYEDVTRRKAKNAIEAKYSELIGIYESFGGEKSRYLKSMKDYLNGLVDCDIIPADMSEKIAYNFEKDILNL